MKISVIVPVYNVEAYVCRCVESIMGQSYRDIEIILVDDGSTDHAGDLCDQYAKKDARIVVIHKTNAGVVSARKAGAAIATGEYIASVDGDDWIEEDYIENFVKIIQETKKEVIWSISYYKEYAKHVELCLAYPSEDAQAPGFHEKMLRRVSGGYGFQNDIDYSICNKCIQRSLYGAVQNEVDEKLTRGEDLYFSVDLLLKTDSIFFCRNDGYHYVQREDSNTNNKRAYPYDAYKALQEQLKKLAENLPVEKKPLQNIIDGYLLCTYMLYFLGSDKKVEERLSPFCGIRKNSRVLIYGAGSIGQNIISYLEASKDYEIAAWIDSRVSDKKIGNWQVQSVDALAGAEFDYVILATNRTLYAEQMRNVLRGFGVRQEKIISIFDRVGKDLG